MTCRLNDSIFSWNWRCSCWAASNSVLGRVSNSFTQVAGRFLVRDIGSHQTFLEKLTLRTCWKTSHQSSQSSSWIPGLLWVSWILRLGVAVDGPPRSISNGRTPSAMDGPPPLTSNGRTPSMDSPPPLISNGRTPSTMDGPPPLISNGRSPSSIDGPPPLITWKGIL